MKRSTKQSESSPRPPRLRRRRPHPLPRWLKTQQDLDEVARRRCLLMLRVLSGELTVSDALEQEQISRQLYYQMEERALHAMLRALAPGASAEETSSAGAIQRAIDLEKQVKALEQQKRRAERLTLLTRKLVTVGTLKTRAGRPRKRQTVQELLRSKPVSSKTARSSEDTSTGTT